MTNELPTPDEKNFAIWLTLLAFAFAFGEPESNLN